MPHGHPIILLKSNLFNMAAVSVKRSIHTLERAMKFLLRFLEFDVNVFKAILSIQRFFNLTEYREVSLKKSLLITHK